ncbi:SDR family oxidoreductase [Nocardioides luti]|uniref:SDR family NAD(P)-dependent oxidoreductase n=1 Tax=Nocardioides luti TaxID=2761101 RepID=UPI001C8AE755
MVGKVINIASNFALQRVSDRATYSASKAGLIALTRSLAPEWARHGVQVNAIALGYFATRINADMRQEPETPAKVFDRSPARRMVSPTSSGRGSFCSPAMRLTT